MTNPSITLTARQLRELVQPVIPFARGDGGYLPVINAVHVRTEGKWLIAQATDRFRLGIKRIAKVATEDEAATEWPAFEALIPLRSMKSILAMSKPTRGNDPALTFSVEDDRLIVEAAGSFDLFDSSRFVHHLQSGEYPKVGKLITEALSTPDAERAPVGGFDPTFLGDFKACGSRTIRVQMGRLGKPLLVTDDDGFIGALMPRLGDYGGESWDDLFGDKPAEPAKPAKKAAPRKSRAKAKAGAA